MFFWWIIIKLSCTIRAWLINNMESPYTSQILYKLPPMTPWGPIHFTNVI